MSKSPISLLEVSRMFPDAEAGRAYFESRRWSDGAICPVCGEQGRVTARKNGFYRCNPCRLDFTVRTGTIFERSKVPLHKWIYAMYLLVTSRKGVSSVQLAKEIGVTQKTAWFMLQRLREACGNDPSVLDGIVEVEECYIGGKEKNKHAKKKLNMGRGAVGKPPVLGTRERGGRVKAAPVEGTSSRALEATLAAGVIPSSVVHTDEHSGYRGLGKAFSGHDTVNHGAGKYSQDGVLTNGIESVWAVLRRGLDGVYHHASPRHLGRYVSEFTFRLNDGSVKRHTLERSASLAAAAVGPRLTYMSLIA